jgi:hypothetical protein
MDTKKTAPFFQHFTKRKQKIFSESFFVFERKWKKKKKKKNNMKIKPLPTLKKKKKKIFFLPFFTFLWYILSFYPADIQIKEKIFIFFFFYQ